MGSQLIQTEAHLDFNLIDITCQTHWEYEHTDNLAESKKFMQDMIVGTVGAKYKAEEVEEFDARGHQNQITQGLMACIR
jgi:hypothetical protein